VEKDTFWVNPFGVAFSLIKKSDLIRVSEKGEILEGGEIRLLNTAAFMIHSAIHRARPDVNAAAHSHSIYGRSFCKPGRSAASSSNYRFRYTRQEAGHYHPRHLRLLQRESAVRCVGVSP
jgi:ribulose-5-phosphate 4-epimerase/fuculose-1-phosphate aldolase